MHNPVLQIISRPVLLFAVSAHGAAYYVDSLSGRLCFSPTIHITGPVENSRIQNNIIMVPEKSDPALVVTANGKIMDQVVSHAWLQGDKWLEKCRGNSTIPSF